MFRGRRLKVAQGDLTFSPSRRGTYHAGALVQWIRKGTESTPSRAHKARLGEALSDLTGIETSVCVYVCTCMCACVRWFAVYVYVCACLRVCVTFVPQGILITKSIRRFVQCTYSACREYKPANYAPIHEPVNRRGTAVA